jgi:hypothetical protein
VRASWKFIVWVTGMDIFVGFESDFDGFDIKQTVLDKALDSRDIT